MIAFYGMGLLGSSFVRAMRKRPVAEREDVRVWNRTHAKAEALAEVGALPTRDPADAARGASRIHLALSDDAAVDEVLERASAGFADGVVIVDHTTTSTAGAAERVKRWAARHATYVHAPVFMGPKNALDSTGVMMISGDRATVDPLRPILETMTGRLEYMGERVDAAAAFKLLGNSFLMFLTSGLADMLSLAKAMGIKPEDAGNLLSFFNPTSMVGARMQRILDQSFDDPSWELAMARKDARLMIEEAARSSVPLAVLPAIAARMDALIAQGEGARDWTVIAKDAMTPR